MSNEVIDSSCIRRLTAGDELAFAFVYKHYSVKVYRIAFRFLKDEAYSEEIVQETFIKLWLTRDKLDIEGNLWLYLFVITKRLSLNALRQQHKSAEAIQHLAAQTTAIIYETEEQVASHELEQLTQKILQKLPPRQQIIFKMSRIDGLTHRQIAEHLHISPNTVKNHMVNAMKSLKLYLNHANLMWLMLLYFRK